MSTLMLSLLMLGISNENPDTSRMSCVSKFGDYCILVPKNTRVKISEPPNAQFESWEFFGKENYFEFVIILRKENTHNIDNALSYFKSNEFRTTFENNSISEFQSVERMGLKNFEGYCVSWTQYRENLKFEGYEIYYFYGDSIYVIDVVAKSDVFLSLKNKFMEILNTIQFR